VGTRGSLPFFNPTNEAKRFDQIVMDRLKDFDPLGLDAALRKGECEACGGGPVLAVLMAAQALAPLRSESLHYANSGDVNRRQAGRRGISQRRRRGQSWQRSAALKSKPCKVGVDWVCLMKTSLLATASALNGDSESGFRLNPRADTPARSPRIEEHRGAFVSLKIKGALARCIGLYYPSAPLYRIVGDMAAQAAFCDPAISTIDLEELGKIDLEISVLTSFQGIQGPRRSRWVSTAFLSAKAPRAVAVTSSGHRTWLESHRIPGVDLSEGWFAQRCMERI